MSIPCAILQKHNDQTVSSQPKARDSRDRNTGSNLHFVCFLTSLIVSPPTVRLQVTRQCLFFARKPIWHTFWVFLQLFTMSRRSRLGMKCFVLSNSDVFEGNEISDLQNMHCFSGFSVSSWRGVLENLSYRGTPHENENGIAYAA